jgi:hypothetical protein
MAEFHLSSAGHHQGGGDVIVEKDGKKHQVRL